MSTMLEPLKAELEELELGVEMQMEKIAAVKSNIHDKDQKIVAMMNFAINLDG